MRALLEYIPIGVVILVATYAMLYVEPTEVARISLFLFFMSIFILSNTIYESILDVLFEKEDEED